MNISSAHIQTSCTVASIDFLLFVCAELLREPPRALGGADGAAVLREHSPQRRLAEAGRGRHPPLSTAA